MAGVSVLCAVLVLLLVGWLLQQLHGRWLAPGPFMALYWAVGLALPPVLAPDFFLSQGAVWYIVMLVAAFALGSAVAAPGKVVRPDDVTPRPLNRRRLRQLVGLGTAAGLAAAAILQAANGYSVTAILSARGLLDAAAAFSIDRYGGDIHTPTVVPLLMAFTYAAGLVAPFAARGLRKGWVAACYLGPFLASAMYAVLTTARAGMLTVALFLFAGWIVAAVYERGQVPRLRLRSVLGAFAAIAVLAGAFVSIAFLRVGSFDPAAQRAIGPKLIGYAVGYMSAFSQWLAQSAPTGPHTWGTSTFAGLVSPGGGVTRGFTEHPHLGIGAATTNIFSAWRFLVEDFGFVGAPLAAFVLGWAITAAWRRVVQQPGRGSLVVLLCGYAYILNGTTQTIFLFTNICVAVAVAAAILCMPAPELPASGPDAVLHPVGADRL